MKYFFAFVFLLFVWKVASSPSSTSLTHRLTQSKVDSSKLGCKCIMTATTSNKTDTTYCLCYNKSDGTLNDSEKCSNLQGNIFMYINNQLLLLTSDIDIVFSFCTEMTDSNKQWKKCLQKACPANNEKKTAKNKHHI